MEESITPAAIAGRTFTESRRGYEPYEVREFLRLVADAQRALQHTVESLEQELAAARGSEEAMHKMYVAATETKRQLISEGQYEAEIVVAEARGTAHRVTQQAGEMVQRAQQEAETVLARARVEAEESIAAARSESQHIRARIERAREAMDAVEQRLRKMASGALDELAAIASTVDDQERAADRPDPIAAGVAAVVAAPAPAPVVDLDEAADEFPPAFAGNGGDDEIEVVHATRREATGPFADTPEHDRERIGQLLSALQSISTK